MKVIDLKKRGTSKVTREHLSNFGEMVYQDAEVRSMSMKVHFKDGTNIGFNRDEEIDEFDTLIRGEDD